MLVRNQHMAASWLVMAKAGAKAKSKAKTKARA